MIDLEAGKPQKLKDGDILELVVTMHPFYVDIVEKVEKEGSGAVWVLISDAL